MDEKEIDKQVKEIMLEMDATLERVKGYQHNNDDNQKAWDKYTELSKKRIDDIVKHYPLFFKSTKVGFETPKMSRRVKPESRIYI